MDVFIVANTKENKKVAVIIEDKTDTLLHDDQVARYVKAVREDKELDCVEADIHFVLFKTGEYTFWERDWYKQDVEKAGIVGHFYSAKDLLSFLTKNKLSSSWGNDYIEYLKSNLPKKSWMTDLSRSTESLKEQLLEARYKNLVFSFSKPKASLGDRKWGISIYGIHGEAISDETKLDINKNYSLYPYASLDPELNTARICVQYNLYYSEKIATEEMEGYKPLNTIGKTELNKWKQKRDLLREYTDNNTKTIKRGRGQMIVYKIFVDVDFNGDWHELKSPLNEAIRIAKKLEQVYFKKDNYGLPI